MKFWDASAILPLHPDRADNEGEYRPSPRRMTPCSYGGPLKWSARPRSRGWNATERSTRRALAEAFNRLKRLAHGWHEVEASDSIRETAVRFLRVHPLRAADAMQLAAAFVVADRRPSSLELVTLDERLAAAARKEGFAITDVTQVG